MHGETSTTPSSDEDSVAPGNQVTPTTCTTSYAVPLSASPIDIVISLCKPRKTCHDPRKVKLVFLQAKLIIVSQSVSFLCASANFVANSPLRTEFRIAIGCLVCLFCSLPPPPAPLGLPLLPSLLALPLTTAFGILNCNSFVIYILANIGYRVACNAVLHWQ